MKRLIVRVEDDIVLNLSRKQDRTETDMAVMYGIPLNSVIEDIKAEIEKASFEHYMEFGEYIGEDCRKEKIVYLDNILEIIDKHIKGD